MEPLTAPAGSLLYLDTNCIIYSVERTAPYADILLPLWQDASIGSIRLVTSSLTLLEVIVGPLRAGDELLEVGYRRLLQQTTDPRLISITDVILEKAARIRATLRLRTPDAIHAATALSEGCTHLLTNDATFRRVLGLTVTLLNDYASP
ncbi:MAG TPA: PIN domain-containing protein [Chloroflexota bacterium]|nr:PIN domain-containing protein [Chloroflexota bacterium]